MLELGGGRKEQRNKLVGPALWVCNELFPKHKVDITITLKQLGETYLGFAWPTCHNNFRPREYAIELNRHCDDDLMLTTLMHEMVHIKQYLLNELQFREKPTCHRKWMGNCVDEEADYYSLPWEVEAYDMQDKLVEGYNKYIETN